MDSKAFKNVWDALAHTPAEAVELTIRSDLMLKISQIVKESGWREVEAAAQCGITQPRLNELLRGRISRFSLDSLISIVASLGYQVTLDLEKSEFTMQDNQVLGIES